MPFTNGFVDQASLMDHFSQHGWDFNAADEQEYQALADRFLGGSKAPGTDECTRFRNGDIIRYNHLTEEFGVLRARAETR